MHSPCFRAGSADFCNLLHIVFWFSALIATFFQTYEILIFSRIFRLDPNFLRSSGLCKVRGDCCGQSARMGLEEWPARNLGRGRRGVDAA